jgi:hypothetical protein
MTMWNTPSQDEVERALSTVGEPSLRRLFFSELQNPEWLEPLAKLRVFTDPGIVETEAGIQAWPWPEGDYLLRIAAERPQAVAQQVTALTDSVNPWVQRTIVEICAALPLQQVVLLVPGILKLILAGPGRVDESKVAGVIERLLDANKVKDAKKLMAAMFSPKPGEEEEMAFGGRLRITSPIDDYSYKQLLARLAPRIAALGVDGVRMVAGWLIGAMRIGTDQEGARGRSIWRPAIGPHEQNAGLYEIDDALIDVVRDVAREATRTSANREAIDFLNSRTEFLIRRIAVEVAASSIEAGDDAGEIMVVAREMLNDPTLLDLDVRPEYAHLARILTPHLSAEELEGWTRFVLGGSWLPADDRLRRVAAWPSEDSTSVTDEGLDAEKRRWTNRLLSALEPVLTGELEEHRRTLAAEFGAVDHPEFSSYMESFTGPTSPKTAEAFQAMSTVEIADYLKTWSPEPRHHWGPTVDGLARVLEGVVAADPQRFEEIHRELVELKPSYTRAVVTGWEQAARTGYRPSADAWESLAVLAAHELDERRVDGDVDVEDDPRWQWVHRALADLAGASLTDDEATVDMLDNAWRVLKPLTGHPDPNPAHQPQDGGSNMDPLTRSLNTVRPAALRSAIRLLGAAAKRGGDEVARLRGDIFATLGEHVGSDGDPSLAVAAVFGEALGRLWNMDETWVNERLDAFLGVTAPEQAQRHWADVVVSVALRSYFPGSAFLRLIRPAIEDMFTAEYLAGDHVEGWRDHRGALQNAASHVVVCIVNGSIPLTDPLASALFGGGVATDVISEALGHLGWQFMRMKSDGDQENPSVEAVERARELIESRVEEIRAGNADVAELRQFHWWVQSDVVGVDWWLPILDMITELEGSLDKTFIGESLEMSSDFDPLVTLRVFERLLDKTDYWRSYDLVQHAAQILAAALLSDSSEASDLARTLLDRFGRQGHMNVLAEVDLLVAAGTNVAPPEV